MKSRLAPTEEVNPNTIGLDLLGTRALVETIVNDQRAAVEAVLGATGAVGLAVDAITARLLRGGSLHYVGAGTSGRLAALDAAEMTPTFGASPQLVQAHVAGGTDALLRSVEGAEDDDAAGAATMEDLGKNDAVIGVSASGSAGFVVAALERARSRGVYTLAITSNSDSAIAKAADAAIIVETGPEVIAGSTRLKAGTAQKIVLNTISSAVMIRLGKVHDNLMVDVIASNRKLRDRALRLVGGLAKVNEGRARELLDAAGGRVKVAVVMERRGVDATTAQQQLERHGGVLRKLM